MTTNKKAKKAVRKLAQKTGKSYQASLQATTPAEPEGKTVEELAAQLEHDLSGEQDWHDKVVSVIEQGILQHAPESPYARRLKGVRHINALRTHRTAVLQACLLALDNCTAHAEDRDKMWLDKGGVPLEVTKVRIEMKFTAIENGHPIEIVSAPCLDFREPIEFQLRNRAKVVRLDE